MYETQICNARNIGDDIAFNFDSTAQTFFLQSQGGVHGPPYPSDIYDGTEPIQPLGSGIFLILDSGEDFQILQSFKRSQMNMDDGINPNGNGGNGGTNGIPFDGVEYSYPTNGLWLFIESVSNEQANLTLHGATNFVYEIFSRTNLGGGDYWRFEQGLFPSTNQEVIPFSVPMWNRNPLFFWARDWTGIDENSNGIPDWQEWDYFRPGTLAYHLSTNAVGRTNGFSNISTATTALANWTYETHSGANIAHMTNYIWSTNFWLKGVQGLSATSVGYSNGVAGQYLITMVSPRHYLEAHHVALPPGALVAFLDTNNVIYWRSVIQRANIGADANDIILKDTTVGILNADLPPSVEYLPILPPNFTNYLPTGITHFVQGIGMNQDMRLFSQPMLPQFTYVNWNPATNALFGLTTNWNVAIRGGDSSDPEMLLVSNQLILVSHNFTAGLGPNYTSLINSINQQMHYLSTNNNAGSDYQLTLFSLTNWPTIHH